MATAQAPTLLLLLLLILLTLQLMVAMVLLLLLLLILQLILLLLTPLLTLRLLLRTPLLTILIPTHNQNPILLLPQQLMPQLMPQQLMLLIPLPTPMVGVNPNLAVGATNLLVAGGLAKVLALKPVDGLARVVVVVANPVDGLANVLVVVVADGLAKVVEEVAVTRAVDGPGKVAAAQRAVVAAVKVGGVAKVVEEVAVTRAVEVEVEAVMVEEDGVETKEY